MFTAKKKKTTNKPKPLQNQKFKPVNLYIQKLGT